MKSTVATVWYSMTEISIYINAAFLEVPFRYHMTKRLIQRNEYRQINTTENVRQMSIKLEAAM